MKPMYLLFCMLSAFLILSDQGAPLVLATELKLVSINAGGERSVGATYAVIDSIAIPLTAPNSMIGTTYVLKPGFWEAAEGSSQITPTPSQTPTPPAPSSTPTATRTHSPTMTATVTFYSPTPVGQCNFIRMSDETVGETWDIAFSVSICTTIEISDFQFDFSYDASALEYVIGDYDLGDLISCWAIHMDQFIEDPGHLRFGAFDPYLSIAAGSEGALAVFYFSVTCFDCCDGDRFPIDVFEPEGGIYGFEPLDGEFTFTCLGMVGDVNGNERISTDDALRCFMFAMGAEVPTREEACRANADRSGVITTSDALCIYQEALGIPNDCFTD